MTYVGGLVLWDQMTRVFEEDVRPVAFLVHDAGEDTVVAGPGRRGWASEALDPAKGRVLRVISVRSFFFGWAGSTWMTTSDPVCATRLSSLPE